VEESAAIGVLTTRPAAGQTGPTRTGWRVAVVGSLADVVASDLPEDFAAPSRVADPSWIRPGRVAWSWWYDSASPRRLEEQRDYVDFAARAGFEYVLVDAGWDPAWVPELVRYAAERDVRILLWTDWHALATPEQRRAVFTQWASWGVAGVKADFLQSDSGERMAVMDDIAADAAAHHLLVDFHGCTVPRGLQRTWPNVMTLEGVWGAEHEKGGRVDDPALNVTLAFTRNVIGSMDYTPVTFSASGRLSTAAAQLAQAIVYESGLQHFADAPSAYTSRPAALELLRAVPAAWDDTRLLAGAPRRSVTLARRAGERWFVGSLSATGARVETVALRFLRPGRAYTARVYADDGDDGIAVSSQTVTSAGTLNVPVAANGGFSVDLSPKD
jgi:alpha-glucosidase